MNHKQSFPIINMGTSLLLVVFIVICLIVFATLSLSSSLRDQKYTDKAVSKGLIKKNTADREKSRLTQKIKNMK